MTDGRQAVKKVPAAHGLAWLTSALLLIRRQPARLMLIGLVLQFLVGFSQVGVLALLLILVMPVFTAGMMQAMLVADFGARPPLVTLFVAFAGGGRLMRLVVLGAIMLAGGMVAVMFVLSGSLAGLDPAVLARLEAGDINALESVDPLLIQRLMFAMLAGLLVSACISYFAVPLVWFRDSTLGRAIKAGLLGMLRNWRPFLVLGLLIAVLAVPVAIMVGIMFAATATGSAISPVYTVIMLLLVVSFQLILFAVQYFSFKDIFGIGAPDTGIEEQSDQLVA